jgi:hypothetical protein
MADGVHAAVDLVQLAGPRPTGDPVAAKTTSLQLGRRDVSPLPPGDRRGAWETKVPPIGTFVTHAARVELPDAQISA